MSEEVLETGQGGQPASPEPQGGTVTEQGGTIQPGGASVPETEQPLSLTRSQLQQMIADSLAAEKQNWLNEAYQNTQSMNDKFERRVNDVVKNFEAAGIKADKAQAAKYLREQDKKAQANANAQRQTQQQIEPAYQQFLQRYGLDGRVAGDPRLTGAYALEKEYGIQLLKEDPEYTEYFGDPNKKFSTYHFQRDYEKALEKKKARTQNQNQPGTVAGIPSMSGAGKNADRVTGQMSSNDIYDIALAEMRNSR